MQIRAIILCCLVVLLDGYDTGVAALTLPSMAKDWSVAPASFGLAMSLALLGMAFGAAFIAPLSDRFGRRPIIMISFAVVGLLTFATSLATSVPQFTALRFLIGLGMGGSLTNALALVSEFARQRSRSLIMTMTFSMVGIGAILGGFVVPPLLAAGGWQAAYVAGGLVPLAIVLAALIGLPESPMFLERRLEARERAAISSPAMPKARTALLLAPGLRWPTLLLWLLCFIGNFATYICGSWLPTIMRGAGWSITEASFALSVYSAGSVVGGIVFAWLVDRGWQRAALIAGALIAVLSLGGILMLPPAVAIWGPLIVTMGVGISGTVYLLGALSGRIYPAELRVAGIGAYWGVGKVGATLAPLAGAGLLALGLTSVQVLASLFLPMLLALGLILAFAGLFRDAEER